MASAQGYRELVAHLASHRAGLCELQMVGVGGTSRADQARLRSYEFEVDFVAESTNFTERKLAFIDLGGSGIGLKSSWSWRIVIDR